MAEFGRSEGHQKIADEILSYEDSDPSDMIWEACDSSCLNGYDGDGSTCYEVFSNGYRLAKKAEGGEVWEIEDESTLWENRMTYFFVGTEDEVAAKLRALLKRAEAKSQG